MNAPYVIQNVCIVHKHPQIVLNAKIQNISHQNVIHRDNALQDITMILLYHKIAKVLK
jgi:hypothetical protein